MSQRGVKSRATNNQSCGIIMDPVFMFWGGGCGGCVLGGGMGRDEGVNAM